MTVRTKRVIFGRWFQNSKGCSNYLCVRTNRKSTILYKRFPQPIRNFLTILGWLVAKDIQFFVSKILITRLAIVTCASNLTNQRPFYWLPAFCIHHKDRRKTTITKTDARSFCPARQAKFRTPRFFFGLSPMSNARMNHCIVCAWWYAELLAKRKLSKGQ